MFYDCVSAITVRPQHLVGAPPIVRVVRHDLTTPPMHEDSQQGKYPSDRQLSIGYFDESKFPYISGK